MLFSEFVELAELSGLVELAKAERIAYYLLKEEGKVDFTVPDLLSLWGELPVPQPNRTRLRERMEQSGDFPRSPKPKHLRLHAAKVRQLDTQYADLWQKPKPALKSGASTFVHSERIAQLRGLTGAKPSTLRLVRLCEEINTCYELRCLMAVALLARTVINHVPPALGFQTFAEVVNNYGGGPKTNKSFKQIAKKLDDVARSIGDMIAHQAMRPTESVPGPAQIDFTQELDVLLDEVARVLREKNPGLGA
jgi:hypothetical protein